MDITETNTTVEEAFSGGAIAAVRVVVVPERAAIELRFVLSDGGGYAAVDFSQVGAITVAGELLAGVRELWRQGGADGDQ